MLIFSHGFTIFMSLHGLFLGSPSMNSILLLHMKRTYIGAVQRGIVLTFLEN